MDDHHFERVGEFADVCAHNVLKCTLLARIGGHGILWTVKALARTVTERNKAFDKKVAELDNVYLIFKAVRIIDKLQCRR